MCANNGIFEFCSAARHRVADCVQSTQTRGNQERTKITRKIAGYLVRAHWWRRRICAFCFVWHAILHSSLFASQNWMDAAQARLMQSLFSALQFAKLQSFGSLGVRERWKSVNHSIEHNLNQKPYIMWRRCPAMVAMARETSETSLTSLSSQFRMKLLLILVNEMSFFFVFFVEGDAEFDFESLTVWTNEKKSSSWRIIDNGLTGDAKEADLKQTEKKMGKKKYDVPLHRAAREEV